MKKIFLITIFVITNNLSTAQENNADKGYNDTISVTFNKVRPSFENWSTAELKVTKQLNSDLVLMNFYVPNFNERFKTTLSDYCIIETDTKQYKLMNQKEVFTSKETMNYSFTLVIPKNDLSLIVTSKLKIITFYFVPNEQFVKNRLAENKFMDESLKKYLGRVAKMTLKYKVSNPVETQYDVLKTWLKGI